MSRFQQVRQQAFQILSRRAHSRHQLAQKLLRRFSEAEVAPVLHQLEEKGYLDDENFALDRALSQRMRKNWGNRRIHCDLKSLGIGATIVDRVLARVNQRKTEQQSLREFIQGWIERRGQPRQADQLKKLFDQCVRHGFSGPMVRESIEPYFENLDWR